MKRILKKIFAPIIYIVESFQILAWETDNGGVDGLTKEDRERLERRRKEEN